MLDSACGIQEDVWFYVVTLFISGVDYMVITEARFDFSKKFWKGKNQVDSGSLLTVAKCKGMILVGNTDRKHARRRYSICGWNVVLSEVAALWWQDFIGVQVSAGNLPAVSNSFLFFCNGVGGKPGKIRRHFALKLADPLNVFDAKKLGDFSYCGTFC